MKIEMPKDRPRYAVCSFPSLYGTPWRTRRWFMACLFAAVRSFASGGRREIRIIDYQTGQHTVWLP